MSQQGSYYGKTSVSMNLITFVELSTLHRKGLLKVAVFLDVRLDYPQEMVSKNDLLSYKSDSVIKRT